VARDPGTGQELAQEAFVRLFARWEQIASADHARNFAYKVAINLARSHIRKHVRVTLAGLGADTHAAVPDPAETTTAWLEVADALGSLSPRQRACVVLVDYADMDAVTVGGVLGLGAGTVRVHLSRGRRALRERLGLEPEEAPA
jgi:RNA polymerase sigma-70 factor (ECF subfamily)